MSPSRSTPFPVSVRPRSGRRFAAVLALAATGLLPQAQAGEVYANVGLPGIGLGYAHPIDSRFTVRADFMTLGSRSKSTTEEGIATTAATSCSVWRCWATGFPSAAASG